MIELQGSNGVRSNLIEAFGSKAFFFCLKSIDYHNVGHMVFLHARPRRRNDQLPLRSLRDLRSRYVFAPVRPRLARWRWEHKQPKGPWGTRGNGDISETRFTLFQKILSAALRFVSQKSKFRSELFRSHSKGWYVDSRTNSDFRSRSFDLFPPTRFYRCVFFQK